MKKLILALAVLAISVSSFSHEGHDNAPGTIKSLHGGSVQAGKQINLEVFVSGQEITVYPISHEGSDIKASDVKIEAKATPKKGKPYPVLFSKAKSGYSAKIDLNGANRVPVTISVTNQGKTDQFTVQVEE
ncbi:MAG: hypothetical protein ACXVLQ_10780 [Bacteriovorax sp.]